MAPLPKVPSYKIYKVENVPQLQLIQDKLKAKGLRDPWMRNEVWRWHPGFGTTASRWKAVLGRGFVPGIILGYLTYLLNKEFLKRHPDFYHWHDPDFPETHHVDHGHGGHH